MEIIIITTTITTEIKITNIPADMTFRFLMKKNFKLQEKL